MKSHKIIKVTLTEGTNVLQSDLKLLLITKIDGFNSHGGTWGQSAISSQQDSVPSSSGDHECLY